MINDQKFVENDIWHELPRSTVIKLIESNYNAKILKEWSISDIVMVGEKFLVKWSKRPFQLSNDDIKEKYGLKV